MDITVVIGLLLGSILILVLYFRRKYSFWSSRGIPGPTPLPLLGNLLTFFHLPYFDLFVQYHKKYGKLVGLYDGVKPKLVVMDADLIKEIMVRNFSSFTDRRTDGWDHPLEQKFLLVMEGQEWKRMRNLMTPAFSSAKLKAMSEHFVTCSDRAVAEVRKNLRKPFEIKALFKGYTIDIIGKTSFGVEFDAYDPNNINPVLECAMNFFQPSSIKTILAYLLPKWFKTLIRFSVFQPAALYAFQAITKVIIEERRKALKARTQSYSDFMSIMLENSEVINDDELAANLFLLFGAGYETAAYHMSYTCFLLAKHPDIQERLFEEVNSACGGNLSKLTPDTVSKLDFLEAVINESFRLYPVSSFAERKVSKECELAGINLPRGTHIFFPIYAIHHSEEYYDHPEEFRPDRFMPENKESIHPYAFLPFGHGPRNCIGMRLETIEAKMVLSKLIASYRICLCKESPQELDTTSTNDEIIFTPDIYLQFEERM